MAEAILSFITANGYLGVFVLMVAENLFPPIPSEVILPFIGHLAASGELSLLPALLVATLGALFGTTLWFLIGWVVSVPVLERFFRRYGGYVAIDVRDFRKATKWFTRYELPAVFFGRMVPAVRSIISIPAGCVRMRPSVFLALSFLGALIWNIILIGLGFVFLDDYTLVSRYMTPIADIIIYLFIGLYLLQVCRFVWRRARHGEAE
ncbi:MAG: hypothetical protein RLZZ360_843 [Candidatus Parcubacteria bacterium]|jgi:membrane protein DedA with SNARE-associated domain